MFVSNFFRHCRQGLNFIGDLELQPGIQFENDVRYVKEERLRNMICDGLKCDLKFGRNVLS